MTTVYIDMDGVIADWEAGYRKVTGGKNPSDLNREYPNKNDRHEYKKTVVTDLKLYENLPVLSDAKKLIKYITSNFTKYQILSACGEYATKEVIAQKRIWLKKHFPELAKNPIFVVHSHQKAAFATKDSILIDDREKSINPFNAKGGIGILHKSADQSIAQMKLELSEEYIMKPKLSNLINEVLITFGGVAYPKFNNVVFLAGGAGSGKGFIKDKLLGIEGYVHDVDVIKELSMKTKKIAAILKSDYDLDVSDKNLLRNPKNTSKLHLAIDDLKIIDSKLKSLYKSIVLSDPSRRPNLIFDVTLKNITKLSNITDSLKLIGYHPTNIHLVWILNSVQIAIEQNKNRSRVVPADILLDTHKGASMTMATIVHMGDAVKKYLDGDIYVVFNNKKEEDVLYVTHDTIDKRKKEALKTEATKKGAPPAGYIEKAIYIKIKPKGGGIDASKITSDLLAKIKNYTPKIDTWDDL